MALKKKTPTAKTSAAQAAPAATAPQTMSKTVAAPQVSEAMIREIAYSIAQSEGFVPGRELDYWLRAERQVRGSMNR